MSRLTPQDATVGQGDDVAALLKTAEALCRTVAGLDLACAPSYLLDDPARTAGALVRDILAVRQPPAFVKLWEEDVVAYRERFGKT